MKKNKKLACHFFLVILCFSMAGCGFHRTEIIQFESGYSKAVYRSGIIHVGARGELQYKDRNGKKTVIWPVLNTHVINDDTIVFLGMLYSESGFRGDHLFAYQPPGPVVDITYQAFELGARERGENLAQVSRTATPSSVKKTSNGIAVGLAFVNWTDREIRLNWNQISDVMREAKEKGIIRKNLLGNPTYLEKEVKPEVLK